MNIPNLITIFRLILVPMFLYTMLIKEFDVAIVILLISGLSDILDGYIARKYNLTTKLGTVLDPIADKLMQLTALGSLAFISGLPYIFSVFWTVLAKEFLLLLGGLILLRRKIVVPAKFYGKIATVVIYGCIFFGILCSYYDYTFYAKIFSILAIISTVFAFVMYARLFVKLMKKAE